MEGVVHLARRGHREEVDDVLLELDGHRRHVLCRTDVAEHGEHLVLVHQLLGRQGRLARVVGRILDDELELATVHTALLVHLVHSQQQPVAHLLTKPCDRAGKILNRAEQHLALAHALSGLCPGEGRCESQCKPCGQPVGGLHQWSP